MAQIMWQSGLSHTVEYSHPVLNLLTRTPGSSLPIRLPANVPRRQQIMIQAVESLPPLAGDQDGVPAPGFSPFPVPQPAVECFGALVNHS